MFNILLSYFIDQVLFYTVYTICNLSQIVRDYALYEELGDYWEEDDDKWRTSLLELDLTYFFFTFEFCYLLFYVKKYLNRKYFWTRIWCTRPGGRYLTLYRWIVINRCLPVYRILTVLVGVVYILYLAGHCSVMINLRTYHGYYMRFQYYIILMIFVFDIWHTKRLYTWISKDYKPSSSSLLNNFIL